MGGRTGGSDGDNNTYGNQVELFALIEAWPERFGTLEWRKRAHRELDGPVHEVFIFHASRKNLSCKAKEEGARTNPEWELFNTERARQFRRQKTFQSIADVFDSMVWLAIPFGAFWLFMWFYYLEPSNDELTTLALMVAAHLAIIVGWLIFSWFRWRNAVREKRRLRFKYLSAEEDASEAVARPLRYADDRISATEFEGRKYRSNLLLARAMQESQERLQREHAGREVFKKGTERAFDWIKNIFSILFLLGAYGFFEIDEGYMMRWVSVVLIGLGIAGAILTVYLKERLHDPKRRYYSSGLRHYDKKGRLKPEKPSRPSLPG